MFNGIKYMWNSSVNVVKKMASSETQSSTPDTQSSNPNSDKMLDLAFAMDCTGSMGSYIHQAQQSIRHIVEEIVSKESADIKLALVEYRDHPPQDSTFVTRVHDFTSSVRQMKGWLDAATADGGGDGPEAVADALHQVLKLNWRQEATKMCVFISDAPPHGLGDRWGGDGFPNGCPDGLDPMETTNELARKSITLYSVGCEPSINPYKEFFHALAHMTGGQYVPLTRANLLAQVIMGGAAEELSLQEVMDDVNQDLLQEVAEAGDGELEEEEIVERIHQNMQQRGKKSKALNLNSAPLPKASGYAEKLSNLCTMEEVRKEWSEQSTVSDGGWGGGRGRRGGGRGGRGGDRGGKKKKSKKSAAKGRVVKDGEVEESLDDWSAEPVGAFGCPPPPPMAHSSPPSPSGGDSYAVSEYEPVQKEQIARMVQKASRAHGVREKFNKKS